jgi:hypothetical protein
LLVPAEVGLQRFALRWRRHLAMHRQH